ncbi:hypothetical protein [Rhodococcus koreensis]|uniref:hypothetical protein n=1 Tax=Rhodococcus koreensis TaxID=99653 RepID=UPI00366AECA4
MEGTDYDASYYGKIAESSTVVRSASYQITRIHTLGAGRGKTAVLKVFADMKRAGTLVQSVSDGSRVTVFLVDRDAEKVLGGSKRNDHVIYTKGYDVESDILANGNDADALLAAASLAPNEARSVALSLQAWRNDAAIEWREWIQLCCVAKQLGVSCDVTYGRNIVNGIDPTSLAKSRATLKARSGKTASEFEAIERRIARKIDSIYRRGDGADLIKGKWLPQYMKDRLHAHFSGGHAPQLKDVEKRIVSAYVSSVDPTQNWSERYTTTFEALLTRAQQTN